MTDVTSAPATAPALLAGKRVLVTGVLTPRSIAFAIADAAQRAGAEVVLTSFGRAMTLTEKSARRLDPVPDVLEMDVTRGDQVAAVAEEVRRRWGGLDGAVHAVGFAPEDCLGGGFMTAPWESVAIAMQVSAFSMKTLGAELAPLMPERAAGGGALVALTFDASVAWPLYDWMGPAKAALEAVVRYLARDLGPQGIRVNAVAAGPLETIAARSIPGFKGLKDRWAEQAPLGWDSADSGPVADAVLFLLSGMARAVSGEVLHVDGGYHALGAPMGVGT
ncbi:MAG: meromycolic acid enoyl-[acyl-carrier-protein] reductase [Chloroflexota bacterium]|nr:meromycolic acid enoyl-[acyl-carrier-protein] reductase [Chloroflexota bacterium]